MDAKGNKLVVERCAICNKNQEDDYSYGEMKKKFTCNVHYFCLVSDKYCILIDILELTNIFSIISAYGN